MSTGAIWRAGRRVLALVVVTVSLVIQAPARNGRTGAVSFATVASAVSKQPPVYIVRVYFNSLAERDRLASQLDAQETSTGGGYVTAIVDQTQLQALQAAGERVQIDPGRTALLNQPMQRLQAQSGGIPNFPCYRTVEETYSSLAGLALTYP